MNPVDARIASALHMAPSAKSTGARAARQARTGLYKGISGTLSDTVTYAAVVPRYTSGKEKGQCTFTSNSIQPLDQISSFTGSGTVKFS